MITLSGQYQVTVIPSRRPDLINQLARIQTIDYTVNASTIISQNQWSQECKNLSLGIPWGTRGTRSPWNPALLSFPDPRGMNFAILRLPELPIIIPRVTRLLFLRRYYLFYIPTCNNCFTRNYKMVKYFFQIFPKKHAIIMV